MWLPRRRISSKPAFLKTAQTSLPDRTRNLANVYLYLCNEHLVTKPFLDFFRGSRLEKKFQRLTQIIPRGFNGVTLACDIQFRTQRNISVALAFDQGSQFH